MKLKIREYGMITYISKRHPDLCTKFRENKTLMKKSEFTVFQKLNQGSRRYAEDTYSGHDCVLLPDLSEVLTLK